MPYSYNLGGWANLLMPDHRRWPTATGRTALVMAGNHGDEYPGQVAILKLMRELKPEQVRGRLILIPALNMPGGEGGDAAVAARRQEPQPLLSPAGPTAPSPR